MASSSLIGGLILCSIYVCCHGFTFHKSNDTLPLVIWHGMGDSCFNTLSMGSIVKLIEKEKPGIYINCLKIGANFVEDIIDGYFYDVNMQVDKACKMIAANAKLRQGYNSMGFSQGAQFLRAVAQRCPSPPMHNLVSVGGQHQGVFGLPKCPESSMHWLCEKVRELLSEGAYSQEVQKHVVQAQYWHDPTEESVYTSKSLFLADINQLQGIKDEYKTNLQKLNAFVLVRFNNDTMVTPRESEWFGYYTPGQDKDIQTLQQSAIYKKDVLGLAAMDTAGRLHFLQTDGDHLQFTTDWFVKNIVKKYL